MEWGNVETIITKRNEKARIECAPTGQIRINKKSMSLPILRDLRVLRVKKIIVSYIGNYRAFFNCNAKNTKVAKEIEEKLGYTHKLSLPIKAFTNPQYFDSIVNKRGQKPN